MTTPVSGSGAPGLAPGPVPDPHARLREVAEELEATFVSEMLKHAGFGEARESFGGGIGEEQFGSMLRTEHARAIVERGGIGLSEAIFASLVGRAEGGS